MSCGLGTISNNSLNYFNGFIKNYSEAFDPVSSVASLATHISGQILPSLGEILKTGRFTGLATSISVFVDCDNGFELPLSINYFVNGGYSESKKNREYLDIAGNISLFCTSLFTTILYVRSCGLVSLDFLDKCAKGMGSVRVFGFAPHIAGVAQKVPGFRSMDLTSKAVILSGVRVFDYPTKTMMGTIVMTTLIFGFACLGAQAHQKYTKLMAEAKQVKHDLDLKGQNPVKESNLVVESEIKENQMDETEAMQKKAEGIRRNATLTKNWRNVCACKVSVYITSFCFGVTNPYVMGTLGFITVGVMGYNFYYKNNNKKPE